jgi:hypothetical protein
MNRLPALVMWKAYDSAKCTAWLTGNLAPADLRDGWCYNNPDSESAGAHGAPRGAGSSGAAVAHHTCTPVM